MLIQRMIELILRIVKTEHNAIALQMKNFVIFQPLQIRFPENQRTFMRERQSPFCMCERVCLPLCMYVCQSFHRTEINVRTMVFNVFSRSMDFRNSLKIWFHFPNSMEKSFVSITDDKKWNSWDFHIFLTISSWVCLCSIRHSLSCNFVARWNYPF